MILSEISQALQHKSIAAHLTDEQIQSLANQYPFSSTLSLLKSKRQFQNLSIDQIPDLGKSIFSSHPHALRESLFSFPAKETDQVIEHVKEDDQIKEEEEIQVHQKNVIDDSPQLTSDIPENTESSSHLLKEMNHLSDYSSWLLQLKNIDHPSQTTEVNEGSAKIEKPASDIEKKIEQVKDNSSELNNEIVSESLANLLAEQGHYTKAEEMYSKLSLIFPEKSAYFAAQIEKIKGK